MSGEYLVQELKVDNRKAGAFNSSAPVRLRRQSPARQHPTRGKPNSPDDHHDAESDGVVPGIGGVAAPGGAAAVGGVHPPAPAADGAQRLPRCVLGEALRAR